MNNIAFNMHISSLLKKRYGAMLAILPIGLMFSSFWISWQFMEWLSAVLNIPEDAPVREQKNGFIWLVIILGEAVVLMLVGYLTGWIMNALIARSIFGWSPEKVKAVFLKSEIPKEWFKNDANPKQQIENKYNSWEETRKNGSLSYILKTGVLGWGSFMFFIMALSPALKSKTQIDIYSLSWQAVLWACAGALFGYLMWYFSERQYNNYANQRNSNNSINQDAP